MARKCGQTTLPGEAGFALIEVVISAALVVAVGGAVLALISATTRSAAQQRARTQAYALAQEDLARMRSMRISSLNGLREVRTLTLSGTAFEVESTGTFVNNTSGTTSCAENESSPDYVRIASTIRQTSGKGSSISLQSIVSPSNGSLDPTHGSVVVAVQNGEGKGFAGLQATGTGAGSFSGTTDSSGCAIFADLPAGSYTLKASGTGLINASGNASSEQSLQVSGNQTQRISLLFDKPGKLKAPFYYKLGTTEFQVVPASVAVFNAELGSTASAYKPTSEQVGSTKYAVLSSLFPFRTAYTLYPGVCEGNKPSASGASASVAVPAGGEATAAKIRMPALEVTVTNGTSAVSGAEVKLTDKKCTGTTYKYTTESSGHQSETTTGPMMPAVPWSTYDICASRSVSGTIRRATLASVPVETIESTVARTIAVTSSSSSGGC